MNRNNIIGGSPKSALNDEKSYDRDMVQWKFVLITLFFTLLWIAGGVAWYEQAAVIIGTVASLLFLAALVLTHHKVVFPKYFLWGCLFIGMAGLSLLWSVDAVNSMQLVLLTASGMMWWIAGRSASSLAQFDRGVRWSVLLAGSVFTFLWVTHSLFGWFEFGPSSLVAEASAFRNHNHLGDWWMVILLLTLPGILGMRQQEGNWGWQLPGLVMVWMMRSRSAILGLMMGGGYQVWSAGGMKKYRLAVMGLGVIFAIMLVGLGMGKGTLESRDYYVQAVAGLINHPWGVGLGNFEVISSDVQNQWWGLDNYASVVHNVLLEWTAGMGWLGITGWVWLGFVAWNLGRYHSIPPKGRDKDEAASRSFRDTIIWRGVFWAMLVNFLFDATYVIPSMWWLFCLTMGMGEGKEG